ncbi:MAG: hypothetical protein AAFP69_22565, partial [Planctomycetota bacterium]
MADENPADILAANILANIIVVGVGPMLPANYESSRCCAYRVIKRPNFLIVVSCAFLLCTLSCGCWSSTPTPQPASPPSAFNAELARLIAGGRYQSAATQIDLRLQQNPNDTSLLITAADVAMRRDRLDDADRYFAAYADAGGSIDESIFMRWVTVATRSGNVLPFTRRMRRLLSTDVEAASATSVVFESDPTSPQVALSVRPATRALFARLLTSIGDIHSANQQRRQLLRESDPRQTPVSSADLIPLIAHMQRYMGPVDHPLIIRAHVTLHVRD